jgi:hypothetical protein
MEERESWGVGVANLKKIEFLFESAEHFVIDFILVAEVKKRGALQ